LKDKENEKQIFIGRQPLIEPRKRVNGSYVNLEGEKFYSIQNYDAMDPFFMTIISADDHWLFISSNGGLTAGRGNPDNAIFPYYTDDKIVSDAKNTGSKTILKIDQKEKVLLWEPFNEELDGIYTIERTLYKNVIGNRLIFKETNHDLNLSFSYEWSSSKSYGFVRTCALKNLAEEEVDVEILDGVQNVLPFGVDRGLQDVRSTLVDAYKKNELIEDVGLGLFTLSSMIVDKAEPSEALKASVVWSCGLENQTFLLSSNQLKDFRFGHKLQSEAEIKAERGAFFVNSSFKLGANAGKDWKIVCDVNQSAGSILKLTSLLRSDQNVWQLLENEIKQGSLNLKIKVGQADGIQLTADEMTVGRHFSNVMFNIMRGGSFEDQYQIERTDWVRYVEGQNRQVFQKSRSFFEGLPEAIQASDLRRRVFAHSDSDLIRLFLEYMPLSFSRRHGDPSRPWNQFDIKTEDEDGNPVRNYEGNWRDIFQNWEALAISFPEFIEGMISRFVNASTLDGYNPYRITREGIDWERIEENDPWSFIGYWGDHQIIYLLKLLELSHQFHPTKLKEYLGMDLFVYSNVPYKIRGFDAILMDPKDTIDFDHALDKKIDERVAATGADGKMAWNAQQELVRCNLTEKILVTSLTKLYNFIPDAGIWLNTQRPEWNDANNALVGNGTSMVTLYYLRRFCAFTIDLFSEQKHESFEVNKPVADLFDSLLRGFKVRIPLLETGFSNEERRKIVDRFGIAGEHFRTSAYSGFLGHKQSLSSMDIISFYELAMQFIDQSIAANKEDSGLFTAYNLIQLTQTEAKVSPLYEMLEGQVAILSSGALTANESLRVLDALQSSKMYRQDQYSYLLYPDRDLGDFLLKNKIDPDLSSRSSLMKQLHLKGDHSLVISEDSTHFRFNGEIKNGNDLNHALKALQDKGFDMDQSEVDFMHKVYEDTFNHRSFTGRSGTFYGYEGLGCIYWHMVSKLLLAVQEVITKAHQEQAEPGVVGRLIEHYYEIRAGIGVNKNPDLYGAFPTDAYSHTPSNKGARQPGMTGQVKEDIINRWAELGVTVDSGHLCFDPKILRREEFLKDSTSFEFIDREGKQSEISLMEGSLAFTFCQMPVVYEIGEEKLSYIIDGVEHVAESNNRLGLKESELIFKRKGEIEMVRYSFQPNI
jgi:hypothetical protein